MMIIIIKLYITCMQINFVIKVDFKQIYGKAETDRNQWCNSHFICILRVSLLKNLSIILNCSNISANCRNYFHFWMPTEHVIGCCESSRGKTDRFCLWRNGKGIHGRFTMEEHDRFCCWIVYLKCFSCLK